MEAFLGLLIFFGMAALLGTAFVFHFAHERQQKARREAAFRALPGVKGDIGPTGAGVVDGTAYGYVFIDVRGDDREKFTLSMPGRSPTAFTVRRETRLDRRAKSIGFAVERQTGDAAFDAEFYLETNDGGTDQPFGLTAGQREAIRRLYGLEATTISHNGTALKVEWIGKATTAAFKPGRGKIAVERMRSLAIVAEDPVSSASLPHAGAGARRPRRLPIPAIIGVVVGAGVGVFILGGSYRPIDGWESGIAGVTYGAIALVIVVAAAALLLRGRSTAHVEVLGIATAGLVALPLAGAGGLWIANAELDRAPHEWRMVSVLHKYRGGGDEKTPMLIVASWRRPGSYEDVQVSSGVWAASEPGRTLVRFTTRPGRFGYEWIATQPEFIWTPPAARARDR